jgi:peptide/nickel transport system permease protein
MGTEPDTLGSFESIDRGEHSTAWLRPRWRDVAFLLSLGVLTVTFLYDYYIVPQFESLVLKWYPKQVEWIFAASLLIFTFYLVIPLVHNRRLTRRYWRQLRTNRAAVASLAWLTVFFVLGLFWPVIGPLASDAPSNNPPVGLTVNSLLTGGCVGEVSNGLCHGSLAHPLGTTGGGEDVLMITIAGMHVALQVALISAMVIMPLAIVVGTVAAYVGGWTDEVLMRYVDIQQTIPAFFVYIVVQFIFYPTLFIMVVVFGLLNWGGMARLVRSEALQKREEGFVIAARNAGVSRFRIIRRHIVPNVSNTVLTTITLQVPLLIIMEATLSYLALGDPRGYSWGNSIAIGVQNLQYYWWISAFPALALLLTVVSLAVLGDALRDVLDPRLET